MASRALDRALQKPRRLLSHHAAQFVQQRAARGVLAVAEADDRDDDEQYRSNCGDGVKGNGRALAQRAIIDEGDHALLRELPRLARSHDAAPLLWPVRLMLSLRLMLSPCCAPGLCVAALRCRPAGSDRNRPRS